MPLERATSAPAPEIFRSFRRSMRVMAPLPVGFGDAFCVRQPIALVCGMLRPNTAATQAQPSPAQPRHGELLIAVGDPVAAEASFPLAIGVARRQNAKL